MSYIARVGIRSLVGGVVGIFVSVGLSAWLAPPPIIAFAMGMAIGFTCVIVAIATTK